ncbi:hypothetical protein M3152_02530 [Sporosarcina luteola]|uniref:hypothetical protein n=1 Tax=Sporosarcina luteola TaxID=582850 RepID=UPI00203E3DFB|nr:hypothetical protein [Sporosarcina luteola]MCM3636582.1 hypothetical protein [Sporosarcina luteola]
MKSKELARLFRKTAVILDYFEEQEIEEAMDAILRLVKQNSASQKEATAKIVVERKKDEETIDFSNLITDMYQMSGEELNDYLSTNKDLKTKKNLLAFAKELSISTSTRQTKDVIKHSIIKYFERRKMDDFIRTERNR